MTRQGKTSPVLRQDKKDVDASPKGKGVLKDTKFYTKFCGGFALFLFRGGGGGGFEKGRVRVRANQYKTRKYKT